MPQCSNIPLSIFPQSGAAQTVTPVVAQIDLAQIQYRSQSEPEQGVQAYARLMYDPIKRETEPHYFDADYKSLSTLPEGLEPFQVGDGDGTNIVPQTGISMSLIPYCMDEGDQRGVIQAFGGVVVRPDGDEAMFFDLKLKRLLALPEGLSPCQGKLQIESSW